MDTLATGKGVSDKGYNLNGIWVNQFLDHTLGVTLGVDFESNPAMIQHQAPWGYADDGAGNAVIGGSKNFGIADSMKRNGALATVQWQPNDVYTGTLDLTYDNFKEVQQAKGMEFPLLWGGATLGPDADVQSAFVQSGTYDAVKPVVRNDYNRTSARVYNFNFDNRIAFDESWTGNLKATYSRATRRDINLESYSGTGFTAANGALDTIGFNQIDSGLFYFFPTLDYTQGVVLTDPQGWGGGNDVVQAGFINAPRTVDWLGTLAASMERSFTSGPFSSLEFGVQRARRDKRYHIDQSFITLGGGFLSDGNAVESAAFTSPTWSCSPLAWMGVAAQTCYDPFAELSGGGIVEVPTFGSSLNLPPNWEVRENTTTAYAQANLDTWLGETSLRGNFGVQAVHTRQDAWGERVEPGSATTGDAITLIPVAGNASYNKFLPSANLIFGFNEDNDLRVSAARTMARARMDQMNASLGVSGNITRLTSTDPNQAYFSASGGNAKLKPTMADNYNVSYEHFFAQGDGYQCNDNADKTSELCRSGSGYFSLSGYYIKLKDYINPSAAFLYDFAAFVPGYLSAAQQAQLGTTQGIVQGPTNDGHGTVKGLQATLNLPFGALTPALDGFGTILSGSRTKSALVYAGNPDPITVPGLSKWVANGTLYYQRGGFEARVSDSYRSSFLGEVSGISASRILQVVDGGSTYDAQVSYSFNSGALKGLTFVLQGSNLSNKIFSTYENNDPRRVLTWERYGRRYEIGIGYKFQ